MPPSAVIDGCVRMNMKTSFPSSDRARNFLSFQIRRKTLAYLGAIGPSVKISPAAPPCQPGGSGPSTSRVISATAGATGVNAIGFI